MVTKRWLTLEYVGEERLKTSKTCLGQLPMPLDFLDTFFYQDASKASFPKPDYQTGTPLLVSCTDMGRLPSLGVTAICLPVAFSDVCRVAFRDYMMLDVLVLKN